MSENVRDEILKLIKRSEELKKASARNSQEAVEISRRLLEIQGGLDERKQRRAKKTSGRIT